MKYLKSNRNRQWTRSPANQQGVVLITGLVFLVILTLLSITAMTTNTLDERMAVNSQDVNRAFQAAESGLSIAFNSNAAFTGTTDDFSTSTSDDDFGDYGANISITSSYRTSIDVSGFQDIETASDEELFKWHYYDIRSTGSTGVAPRDVSRVIGAGAMVLGR